MEVHNNNNKFNLTNNTNSIQTFDVWNGFLYWLPYSSLQWMISMRSTLNGCVVAISLVSSSRGNIQWHIALNSKYSLKRVTHVLHKEYSNFVYNKKKIWIFGVLFHLTKWNKKMPNAIMDGFFSVVTQKINLGRWGHRYFIGRIFEKPAQKWLFHEWQSKCSVWHILCYPKVYR